MTYRTRPATVADIPAIQALVGACERELTGAAVTDADRIAADLARPGMDPATDSRLAFDDTGELAAWAWVDRRSEAAVHPAHRGRGLGGELLRWIETRAREAGTPQVVQAVPDADVAAGRLLRARGYDVLVTSWELAIAMPVEPVPPAPPTGITVRSFRAGDAHAAHRMLEDAFDEWQPRRHAYGEWAALTVDRASFAPGLSPVAFAGDRMVGAVLSLDDPARADGYIERVGVHRDHRNQGIARLLLRRAFRDFHRAGRRSCTLWTHSDTGALPLYQRVGMSVRHSSTVYRKALLTPAPR
ncbi:GNAT family N-acetyltransferase [Actinoplanes sp. NPDC051494]|uniref:GNAT family N-acetyltransferase n=1 Tax=Actinoplanes sp. NPDC051494 TaxID=3363907 RepID=UPI00378B5122